MQLPIQSEEFRKMPKGQIKTNGQMISTATAAEMLGISQARVRRMILDGFFEGVEKFGTNRAIPLAEVERVVKEREGKNPKGGRPPKEKGN